MKATLFMMACVITLLPVTSAAQSNTSGYIYGQVQSGTRQALEGATVELVNDGTGVRRLITTGADGRFRFSSVPVGDYRINASRDGFEVQTIVDVHVNLAKGRNILILLRQSSGELIEEIEVIGERLSRIDLANTESTTTVTKNQIDRMPIGRSTTSIALLRPGTVPGDSSFGLASFGGASVAENVYYINGMNVTDFRNGLGFSGAPFEFYQEYEIKTGGFSAEFGRSTGGVVNAVTKSGTNEFQFGAGVIYSSDDTSASLPNVYREDGSLVSNNKADGYESTRLHAYAAGPIIEDRAFFYIVYAPRETTTDARGIDSRSLDEWDRPYWGAKLDVRLGRNHLLEVTAFSDQREGTSTSYSYDSATDEVGEFRGTTNRDFGGDSYVVSYTGFLTESFSVSFLAGENDYEAVTSSPLDSNPVIVDYRDFPNVVDLGSWVNFWNGQSRDNRETYRVDLDWVIGNHALRAGLDREINTSFELESLSGGEAWFYDSVVPGSPLFDGLGSVVPPGVTQTALRYEINNGGTFELESSAYYVQDFWQVTDNLMLSLGLRLEQFDNKNALGETFLSIHDQWAPRVGFAWDVQGDGRSKLFGTVGRYHLPLPTTVNIRLAGGEYWEQFWYELVALNPDDTPIVGAQIGGSVVADGLVPDTRASVDANIEPMYQDEFILGYVRNLWDNHTAGVRGVYRDLPRAIEDIETSQALNAFAAANGYDSFFAAPFSGYALTNPGRDMTLFIDMDFDGVPDRIDLSVDDLGVPKVKREYRAMEFFFERRWQDDWSYHVSYTWSKSEGNHEGYVKSDTGQRDPGFTSNFDYASLSEWSEGYLPNDRRHSLKAHGAWQFRPGWILGFNSFWTSGRPINGFGFHPTDAAAQAYGPEAFYKDGEPYPRGSGGRTPSLFQLDLSLQYRRMLTDDLRLRVTAEVFNVFNEHGVREVDEFTVDFLGRPSPDYRLPTSFQTPRTVRVGMHVDFGG